MPWIQISINLILISFLFFSSGMLLANENIIYAPRYAQGFRIIELDRKIVIQVRQLNDLNRPADNVSADQMYRSLAITSTTHFPYLNMLGLREQIVAVSGKKYFQQLSGNKKVLDLGHVPSAEKLKKFPALVLLAHVESSEELEIADAIKRLKISMMTMRDHLEPTFLGRAEWIVALGYLLGKADLSISLFKDIEGRYLELAWKKSPLDLKVVVASLHGDQWQLKDPKGPFGRILTDAGVNLPKGELLWHKEKFHELIKDADICILEGQSLTKAALMKHFPLSAEWKCLKNNLALSADKMLNKSGGNDFWETAVVRPDLLLQEYMILFHSPRTQHNQLRWHRTIK